ncbi:MAG: DUF5688 family protein [Lachnospiraceae bacterium]|nr:DUF5688 family protein [Lachnospiraceae bacterium]
MEFKLFIEKVTRALQEYYGEEVLVNQRQVLKNNGVTLQGICVMKPGENIAPTFYLEDFFALYQEGTPLSEIVEKLIRFFEENGAKVQWDSEFIKNYERIRRHLGIRLIHKEKNEALLKDIPYQTICDLAICCHCNYEMEGMGRGSFLIRKEYLVNWNITEEQLMEDAIQNAAQKNPYLIKPVEQILFDMYRKIIEKKLREMEEEIPLDSKKLLKVMRERWSSIYREGSIAMTILTNQSQYYGASCIAYPGLLAQMGETLEKNYYVIPSSIHEVILVPEEEGQGEPLALNEIVQEINAEHVAKEEVLSNHIYYFDREKGTLECYL